MKKPVVASAALLTLGLTAITAGHAIAPIESIPNHLFQQVPEGRPLSSPQIIIDTFSRGAPTAVPRPEIFIPPIKPKVVTVGEPVISTSGFRRDPEVSWYGPGFYGKRTACGYAYTKTILGVAHRSLACGTKVTFLYEGKDGISRKITVPVIDRGPYVSGRQWDLSGALCTYLHHCFTGPLYYALGTH